MSSAAGRAKPQNSVWTRTIFALLVFSLVVSQAAGQPGDATYSLPMTNETSSSQDPALPTMTLSEIEEEITRRRADIVRYQERLDDLSRQNEEVRRDFEQQAAVLRSRESVVRSRIITLCRLGRGGYIQLLRGARSWSDLLRRSQLVRCVVDSDLRTLREHQQQVEALENRRRELDQRMAAQQDLAERLTLYQQELEAELERRTLETIP